MSVELHLPDLPEVPIALGAARPRRRAPRWDVRLRELLSAYLPLLLMLVLALGSWWLVKNLPQPPKPREAEVVRTDPDYTMSRFVLERFEPSGQLKVRIEGTQMRHFPQDGRVEVDGLALRAFAPDGRVAQARARQAVSNADHSEVQLMGDARIDGQDRDGQPVVITGEYLHFFTVTERVRSDRPVRVQRGGVDLQASTLDYDHAAGRLALQGPHQVVLPARASRP